jgi:putative membrane protein
MDMKTMKALPHFLVVGALAFGSACSSTSPESGASASTNTADAAANNATSTDAAGAGASSSTASTDATGTAADPTAFMATFATMQDPVFLMNAASSNMLEVRAGQMAAQKASNAEVRKFAQMMVSHHSQATQQVKAVAAPLGVQMPTVMMPVHQAMADRLMGKSGKSFDETYMDMMETAHKLDIAMFEVKSKAAETPNVQSYATQTLPMLRSHYDLANALEKKVD